MSEPLDRLAVSALLVIFAVAILGALWHPQMRADQGLWAFRMWLSVVMILAIVFGLVVQICIGLGVIQN